MFWHPQTFSPWAPFLKTQDAVLQPHLVSQGSMLLAIAVFLTVQYYTVYTRHGKRASISEYGSAFTLLPMCCLLIKKDPAAIWRDCTGNIKFWIHWILDIVHRVCDEAILNRALCNELWNMTAVQYDRLCVIGCRNTIACELTIDSSRVRNDLWPWLIHYV